MDIPTRWRASRSSSLRRFPGAPEYPEEELERIQAAHLEHLDALRADGLLLAAGPFENQPDESLRGIGLFRTDLEETRRIMAEDPAVRADRLVPQIMTWMFQAADLPIG